MADVDPEVKGQAKPAGNVDPEVERLADAMALTDCGVEGCSARRADAERIAAAVLADLRERYVLVPRGGLSDVYALRFDDEPEITIFSGDGQPIGDVNLDWFPGDEKDAADAFGRFLLDAFPKKWAEEATDALLSAQNGPDDSHVPPRP